MRNTTLLVIAIFALLTPAILAVDTQDVAPLTKQQAATLLTQASELFRDANTLNREQAADAYTKAAVMYEQIINEGRISNPGLYYNLANCYLMTGNIGRAILNYRRAQTLDRSDPQIHKNLEYARSQRVDQVQMRVKRRVLSRLLFWHYDFSLRSRFITALVLYALLMLLIALRLFIPQLGGVIPASILVGVVLLCFAGSVAADILGIGHTESGVILAKSVVARQGNGENYPESFSEPLHEGTEFDVIEQRPRWTHIRLYSGDDTWIAANTFELIGMK